MDYDDVGIHYVEFISIIHSHALPLTHTHISLPQPHTLPHIHTHTHSPVGRVQAGQRIRWHTLGRKAGLCSAHPQPLPDDTQLAAGKKTQH